LRDTYQAIVDGDGGAGTMVAYQIGLAIASRSGEIRTFGYKLTIGTPDAGAKIALNGNDIVGTKTFNVRTALQPVAPAHGCDARNVPRVERWHREGILKLDVRYLARIRVPLFRITPSAMALERNWRTCDLPSVCRAR